MRAGIKIDQDAIQRSLKEARARGYGSISKDQLIQNEDRAANPQQFESPRSDSPRAFEPTGALRNSRPAEDTGSTRVDSNVKPFPRSANLTSARSSPPRAASAATNPFEPRHAISENYRGPAISRPAPQSHQGGNRYANALNNRAVPEEERIRVKPTPASAQERSAPLRFGSDRNFGQTIQEPERRTKAPAGGSYGSHPGANQVGYSSQTAQKNVRICSSASELVEQLRESLDTDKPQKNFVDVHLSRSMPAIEKKLLGPSFTSVMGCVMNACIKPTFAGSICLSALLLVEGTISASFFGGDEIARASTGVSAQATHRNAFSMASLISDANDLDSDKPTVKSRRLVAPPIAVSQEILPLEPILPREVALKVPVVQVPESEGDTVTNQRLAAVSQALQKPSVAESARGALANAEEISRQQLMESKALVRRATLSSEGARNAEAIKVKSTANAQTNLRYRQELIRFISGVIAVYRPTLPDSGTVAQHIVEASLEEHIDPLFIAAVVATESKFTSNARSSAGAMGLMQLMPATASLVARERGQSKGNLNEPRGNLHLGIHYLKSMIDRYRGNKFMALAAYNWGPGNVDNGRRIPGSVRDYASTISSRAVAWKRHFASASVIADALEQRSNNAAAQKQNG